MSSNGSHLQSKQEIQNLTVDLVILGGGIAGLWCLDRVRQAGYQAILLEPGTIGGGQTVFSQGIIHGGAKYTLDGVLSGAANAIKAMPGRWRDCLEGHGEVDLRGVEILSPAHYLWSTQSLSAKMTSFFASKVMQGRTLKVAQSERPEVFQDARFKGSLYQLDELVLDIPSVLAKLYNRNKSVIFQSDITLDAAPEFNADDTLVALQFHKYPIKMTFSQLLVCAGSGFEKLQNYLNVPEIKMQLRPLHMAMVEHDQAPDIYAHCIGSSAKPLLTITTHPASSTRSKDHRKAWYLGGLLAEEGVEQTPEALITKSENTLKTLLPWVQLQNPKWKTLRVDRAEPHQDQNNRPDQAYCQKVRNIMIGWPTKLALAPDLSDRVLQQLGPINDERTTNIESTLSATFGPPKLQTPLWGDASSMD